MKQKIKNNRQNKSQQKPAAPKARADVFTWWKDKRTLLFALILVSLTFIVMSPSLKNEFVGWDDDYNVYENQNITGLHTDNIKSIFTTPVIGNYNPLTILSFAVEYHFFKLEPFYYHLDNLFLHLVNTFLVFLLIMLLGLRNPWAFIAALLFGIHPMRVESVAWITERKDVLYCLFYLLTIISYIYHFRRKKVIYLLLTYLFFILSLLSKIQAVTLPLSLLLVDYILNRELKTNLIIKKIPYFLLSLSFGFIGIYFLGKQKSLDPNTYTIIERMLIGTYSICIYIIKTVIPYQLSALYPYPKTGDFPVIYYITPVLLILLGWIVYRTSRHNKAVIFGLLFFLVNIIFLLQVVSAGQGFIADRFTYLPYLGLFYLFGSGLSLLVEKRKSLKPLVVTIVIAVLVSYGAFSYSRTKVWQNSETLFTDVMLKEKNIAVAYHNRGIYYRDKKMNNKALADFTNALRIKPDDYSSYISRSKLYFITGDYEKAFTDINKAISLNSSSAEAFSNRGAIYGIRKQYALAIIDLNKAILLNPKMKDALLNRSFLYYKTRQYENSIKDCDAYIYMFPENTDMLNQRALCKALLKHYDDALKDYDLAISYKPDNGILYQNRSMVYLNKGDKVKALEDIRKAEQLGVKVSPEYISKLKS